LIHPFSLVTLRAVVKSNFLSCIFQPSGVKAMTCGSPVAANANVAGAGGACAPTVFGGMTLAARTLTALLALLSLAIPLRADEYFFDSRGGSDGNSGTSPQQAFASLAKLASLRLGPGDVVRFRRGRTFWGRLAFQGNGAEARPLRLTTYGEGAKPEFLGSVVLGEWEQHAGEVYRCVLEAGRFQGQKKVFGVFQYPEGGVPVRLARGSAMPGERGRFWFDAETLTLYVITGDGTPPSAHRLEVSVIEQLVDLTDRRFVEIDGLAFLFGNCRFSEST
jgi:hypothetical protein